MMSTDSSNIPGLDTILRGEIMRKDGLINQLVGQNKELMAAKDRQDIELTAQDVTTVSHVWTTQQRECPPGAERVVCHEYAAKLH